MSGRDGALDGYFSAVPSRGSDDVFIARDLSIDQLRRWQRRASSVALDAPMRFHRAMRLFFLFCVVSWTALAVTPRELAAALETFRSDPPRGWSFTQTTSAEGRSTVERSDATRPEFDRWSLIQKDGRAPTPKELQEYAEARSRRSRTGTAPKLVDQFVLEAVEVVAEDSDVATYRCPLRPGESRDKTALFLRATIVVHKPTHTVQSIELSNIETFSPTIGVKITALKTVMTYSLPAGEIPSLPQQVSTHIRGSAFVFKTLDADMTVTFADYVRVGKR